MIEGIEVLETEFEALKHRVADLRSFL